VKFTILCAAHDCNQYIGKAIRSVLKQTYKNWEMIVADDCSKDDTYERACGLAEGHENIRVYRNEQRLYCANNYQKMLEIAIGDICGVLDGDDELVSQAMERIIGLYRKYTNLSWIYTQSWWCNDQMKPRRHGLSRLPLKGELLFMGRRLKH